MPREQCPDTQEREHLLPSQPRGTGTQHASGMRPAIETRQAAEVRQKWGEIVEGVSTGRKRVVVERYGRPIAVLISAEELARLDELERQLAEPFRQLSTMRDALSAALPEELKRVAQAIERMRQELERLQQAAT